MTVATAGRRIDAEDAKQRRFQLADVEAVRGRIRDALGAVSATTVVASGACGADLIALSVAGELGLRRQLVLPYDAALFRERSVVDRPGPWGEVFDRILTDANESGWLHVLGLDPASERVYERTNEAVLGGATTLASGALDSVRAFVVWDGPIAGRTDYSRLFAEEARRRRITVVSIPITK